MPSYNIERWDSVIPPGHTQPLPMIYIKPDEEFIALAKDNNYNVILTISNTGKLYDTKPIPGVIDSSGYFPDFRPNFFNDKKLMVICHCIILEGPMIYYLEAVVLPLPILPVIPINIVYFKVFML